MLMKKHYEFEREQYEKIASVQKTLKLVEEELKLFTKNHMEESERKLNEVIIKASNNERRLRNIERRVDDCEDA